VLPDGYGVERDADVLTLLRTDGTVVARFSARGATWHEVQRAATEDSAKVPHRRFRRARVRHPRRPGLPRNDGRRAAYR
jgi:hypothetical protein